ncbi:MAG: stage II sporulation protein M [Romboutsia sp.]|uniref:stage II sporulation protein M n=1 Tax=Romboutsia sp. TaxID=1965302 RepID=UPI003F38D8E6
MRKTYRKKSIEKINNQIIIIGVVFIFAVAIGAYLNKIWTFSSSDIFNNISPAVEYYSSDITSKDAIISNLKSDAGFMAAISIFTLLVVTAPLVAIIFILKGVSIGYTINSCILGLQFKSIKMILIMLLKNIIIIPGAIILIIISLNYMREIISSLKKNNKENILFLGRRYLLNGAIVSATAVVLQLLLNTVGINIIKFLVR